ncbi:MAG: acetate/propionate family kinase [Gammaproteobacteria bacterium]
MADAIVVLNAGSSSIKFSLFALGRKDLDVVARGQIEGLFTSPKFVSKDENGKVLSEKSWGDGKSLGHEGALDHLVAYLRGELKELRLVGVGHRIAHGGPEIAQPLRVDDQIIRKLEKFIPLAPLHQPHNLAPIRFLLQRAPQLSQVACFDTSFHRTNPQISQLFALPMEYFESGVRRYGFHGLSYEYIASVLSEYEVKAARGRTIVLHLGNGASMCALESSRSVACTMGFCAVDGLMMGTRSGSLDPGVVLFLMAQRGMSVQEIEKLIYTESGLLGVSGISSDMRALLASDDRRAKLAVDLYVYRIQRELGSLAAALNGLDSIVFTGGIGENAALIRARVCRDAAWLGVELDEGDNTKGGPRVNAKNSRVSAWVIRTNEELMIARHTRRVLGLS